VDRPDLVACTIAAERHTDRVTDLCHIGILAGRGVHIIWGVPHLCRTVPIGMIHIDQSQPSWN
jgi:hypothetical protein